MYGTSSIDFPAFIKTAGYGTRCDVALAGHNLAQTNDLIALSAGECGGESVTLADWVLFEAQGDAAESEGEASHGESTPTRRLLKKSRRCQCSSHMSRECVRKTCSRVDTCYVLQEGCNRLTEEVLAIHSW